MWVVENLHVQHGYTWLPPQPGSWKEVCVQFVTVCLRATNEKLQLAVKVSKGFVHNTPLATCVCV